MTPRSSPSPVNLRGSSTSAGTRRGGIEFASAPVLDLLCARLRNGGRILSSGPREFLSHAVLGIDELSVDLADPDLAENAIRPLQRVMLRRVALYVGFGRSRLDGVDRNAEL